MKALIVDLPIRRCDRVQRLLRTPLSSVVAWLVRQYMPVSIRLTGSTGIDFGGQVAAPRLLGSEAVRGVLGSHLLHRLGAVPKAADETEELGEE